MPSQRRSILQTRFFYVASIFAVSLGVVSFMWHFKGVNWILFLFALAWVVIVTAFAYEIATRAEVLDTLVRARTDALERTNRSLSVLLEQLNAFHRISYEIAQQAELDRITETFARSLHELLAEVDSAWLWLDADLLKERPQRGEKDGRLVLAAQSGEDFGHPPWLLAVGAGTPVVSGCFEQQGFAVCSDLQQEAAAWGWDRVARSDMRSFAAFALRAGSGTMGAVGVFSRSAMSAGFVSQLHQSANQLAVALEKARLLDETRQRAEQLAAANEELRQLDAMKDWFVSSVSHELRTPLTSIRSFAEILENYSDVDPQERLEFAGIVRQESERLSDMIDNLLDLAKIADGRADYRPERFQVGETLTRCCKLFAQQASKRGIEFSSSAEPGLPSAYADPEAVARVLNNLLSNAFKFTPDGGRILVRARSGGRKPGDPRFVTIEVSDSGAGIDPKDHQRIFEKFTQLGTGLMDRPKGAGLGLAICREIVASSGGEIWVESEPGKGSTFAFTLPVGPARG